MRNELPIGGSFSRLAWRIPALHNHPDIERQPEFEPLSAFVVASDKCLGISGIEKEAPCPPSITTLITSDGG